MAPATGCRYRRCTRSSRWPVCSGHRVQLGPVTWPVALMSPVIRHRVRAGEQRARRQDQQRHRPRVAGICTAPGQAGGPPAQGIASSSGLRLGQRPAALMSPVIRHRLRAGEQRARRRPQQRHRPRVAGIGAAPGQAGGPSARCITSSSNLRLERRPAVQVERPGEQRARRPAQQWRRPRVAAIGADTGQRP